MYAESYEGNNLPVNTRTFQPKGKKWFNMSDGLQGPDLEIAKTRMVIGRSLSRLRAALQRLGYDDPAIGREIKAQLYMNQGFAAQCVQISIAYRPDGDEDGEFAFYYLISIPHEVLFEFVPHVIRYFKNPSQGIGPNMWVTKKSIEIYVALYDGQPDWWDLKFLTPEQVKALPALVTQTGRPPETPSSNKPRTEPSYALGQPPYKCEDSSDYMGFDGPQEPLSAEEAYPHSQEQRDPLYQGLPDPIDLDEYYL